MRVAILEPFPRMCGVTAWSHHVAQGFRDLGHESDVVTFTPSGRKRTTSKKRRDDGSIGSGWHWWPEASDVTEKWSVAPDVLDKYDLVVLNEPKNGTADRDAKKQTIVPEYVTALERTKTPWMTILHAPQYDEKRAPFLERCMSAGNFTGAVIEHQAGSFDSGRWAFDGRIKMIQPWPWLPYRRKKQPASSSRGWVIGAGGRMTWNKGQAVLAYLADRLPVHYTTRLMGTESGGAGPSVSFVLYEALVKYHGWRGERSGPNAPDELQNRGDKIHCWPWWLTKTNELGMHVLEYTAGYDDQLSPWARCAIAVNLTSKDFAVGLEYTSLEAMDAGCVIILPSYSLERTGSQQYDVLALSEYTTAISAGNNGLRLTKFSKEAGDEIVGAVNSANDKIIIGQHDPAVNRAALDAYHAPRHVAGKILEII